MVDETAQPCGGHCQDGRACPVIWPGIHYQSRKYGYRPRQTESASNPSRSRRYPVAPLLSNGHTDLLIQLTMRQS